MEGITSSDKSVKRFLKTDGWPDFLNDPASRSFICHCRRKPSVAVRSDGIIGPAHERLVNHLFKGATT